MNILVLSSALISPSFGTERVQWYYVLRSCKNATPNTVIAQPLVFKVGLFDR